MRQAKWIWLLALLAALPAAADRKFIVKAPKQDVDAVASRHGLKVLRSEDLGGRPVSLVESPAGKTKDQVLIELGSEPAIESVEHDSDLEVPERRSETSRIDALRYAIELRSEILYHGSAVRSAYVNQPAAGIIRMADAHERYGTGDGIVAVLDTGVDPEHPALRDVLVPGYDFTRDAPGIPSEWLDIVVSPAASALSQSTVAILDGKTIPAVLGQSTVAILDRLTAEVLGANPLPESFGHGTMVAGLVHLVAPRAKIMPLKVFHAAGNSDLYDIVRAVYYAADNGAKVINMSFSLPDPSESLSEAIEYAASRRVIVIASAGNEGREGKTWPAAHSSVIGVGSTDNYDIRSSFSNFGACSILAAPGEALVTAYPGNNYAGVWGTSFSAALVSGAVAAMLPLRPTLSRTRALEALAKAEPVSQGLGKGRLDLYRALRYLDD